MAEWWLEGHSVFSLWAGDGETPGWREGEAGDSAKSGVYISPPLRPCPRGKAKGTQRVRLQGQGLIL